MSGLAKINSPTLLSLSDEDNSDEEYNDTTPVQEPSTTGRIPAKSSRKRPRENTEKESIVHKHINLL